MGYNPISGESYSTKENVTDKQANATVKAPEEENTTAQATTENDNTKTTTEHDNSAQAAPANTANNGNAQKPDNTANGNNAQKVGKKTAEWSNRMS